LEGEVKTALLSTTHVFHLSFGDSKHLQVALVLSPALHMITDKEHGHKLDVLVVTAKQLPRKHFLNGLINKALPLWGAFFCLFHTNSFVALFIGGGKGPGFLGNNADISEIKGCG